MSPTFHSLSIRNYRIYFAGSMVSNIGTWLQQTALAWLVLELTGSGAALGATIALYLLPTLLFSPIAGAVADRVPKRSLLLWMQVAMSVPAGFLGVFAILGHVEPWHVYVLTFLLGIGKAFEAPARQSFVSEMVDAERLTNAVALNSASFNSGRLIGPGLAGLLIAALGSGVVATGWVILLNAISFWFVVGALLLMDRSALAPAPISAPGKRSVLDGARYVASRPDLLLLFVTVFFLGAFGMNFQITSALMATDVFGKGAGEFGVLGSILAIGSLVGALLAARRPKPRLRFIIGAALVFSVAQVMSGLMPTYWSYAAVLPLIGISVLTTATTANAVIQLTTVPEMRGRVVSLYLMVFVGSTPLGAPVIGWIGEHVGPREALVVSGLIAGLGIAIAALLYARRHDLDGPELSPLVRRMLGRQRFDQQVLARAD
ncbi:MFS transporter [Aeromicrobium choanae]|uniref:Predicted arabinose efflux permease, MFS family n=1 Tax=Aeromicrobium choanae TaxID=1736691 RepID=A0A1T4Z2U4_9ACTN|nr:MFS transporter [Aeromicrobium choanae]SKB08276.1 Predicted arabinose efflux permease, MFS family [Aeromicrobium choanae]